MTAYTAEQIIAIGGNEWRTATKHRVYLNDWADLTSLEIDRYKSGNVRYAWLNGQKISNTKATSLAAGKVYWENGDIWYQGVDDSLRLAVAQGIADQVAAAAAAV